MQRKITLLTALLFISFMAANAQFTTGKYLLGGDLNFRTQNDKELNYKDQGANVNLKLGKVMKENTVFGITLSYGYLSNELPQNTIQKTNRYGAGIFYRKYKPLSKDFHLFGEAGLNYNYAQSESIASTNFETKTISNGVTIQVIPGLSYSLTNKVQIELLMPNLFRLDYSHDKVEKTNPGGNNPPDKTKSYFSFFTNSEGSLLLGFGVGFKFILGK